MDKGSISSEKIMVATQPTPKSEDVADHTSKMTVILEVKNLNSFYGSNHVIKDLNIKVFKNLITALIGPSGCGKSTLLRMVAGLIPFDGSLTLHEQPVEGPRPEVGMMFQTPTLRPWRSALENVLLPAVIRGRDEDDRERALHYLHLVGLKDREFAYPKHLSGGMQQRVSLARLLLTGADVLLLDEPFGALDEITRQHLNQELMDLWARDRWTGLFVTHNVYEAVFLSSRLLVMTARPGRLLTELPVPFSYPRGPEIRATAEFARIAAAATGALATLET